jgi:hypothetical protein
VDEEFIVSVPEGSEELRIQFTAVRMADDGDRIEIYDGDGQLAVSSVPNWWGGYRTPPIPGDGATIRLVTNSSGTSLGFRVGRLYYR